MTALDLPAIRALHAAATPGEWKAWDRGIGWEVHSEHDEPLNSGCRETFEKADAAFIAAAPSIVTQLLAAIDDVLAISDIGMNSKHGDPAFIQGWECALEEMKARIEGEKS